MSDILTSYLDKLVDDGKLPGVAIQISHNQNIVYSHCYGVSDDKQTPFGFDTLCRIFSMTKPILSVGIMVLAERDLIRFDDPISLHLPEWQDNKVRVFVKFDENGGCVTEAARSPITIHHLLTHTSGIDYGFWSSNDSVTSQFYRTKNLEIPVPISTHSETNAPYPSNLTEFCSRLLEVPLAFHPGTRFQYSCGTDVLGRIIESVTKQNLATFISETITRPLGMFDTFFSIPESRLNQLATCYRAIAPPNQTSSPLITLPDTSALQSPPFYRFASEFNIGSTDASTCPWIEGGALERCPSGGGGLISCVNDYIKFSEMLTNNGTLGDVTILSPQSVAHMRKNFLEPTQMTNLAAQYLGFGYGLSVGVRGVARACAGGWGGVAGTYFLSDAENGISLAFTTQVMDFMLVVPNLRPDVCVMTYELCGVPTSESQPQITAQHQLQTKID
eukprot:c9016_g1_i2.p1 GENE.c9016_g1_i2~~c9016_g1_i2.p1  ORF type:complete len:453 (+),score=95.06 c9016_g1_i2:23-1360(+)